MATGAEQRFGHEGWVWSVAWDTSGTRLATGSADNSARIWNVSTGAEEQRFGHEGWVFSVAWDTSGTRLATGSEEDKLARVFSEPVDLGVEKFLRTEVNPFPWKLENASGGIPRLRIPLVHLVPRLCRFTSTSWKIHRTNTGPQRSKTEGLVHTPLG